MFVELFFIILFLIIGILILKNKLKFLFSSKNDDLEYNLKNLRIALGSFMFYLALIVFLIMLSGFLKLKWLTYLALILLILGSLSFILILFLGKNLFKKKSSN